MTTVEERTNDSVAQDVAVTIVDTDVHPLPVSGEVLKAHRARVLTAEDPVVVRRHLADAYAAFADLPHRSPPQAGGVGVCERMAA